MCNTIKYFQFVQKHTEVDLNKIKEQRAAKTKWVPEESECSTIAKIEANINYNPITKKYMHNRFSNNNTEIRLSI